LPPNPHVDLAEVRAGAVCSDEVDAVLSECGGADLTTGAPASIQEGAGRTGNLTERERGREEGQTRGRDRERKEQEESQKGERGERGREGESSQAWCLAIACLLLFFPLVCSDLCSVCDVFLCL
jgi:hypothetical protein